MLKHCDDDGNPHIDWYRKHINECIMLWHDATDETLDTQRGPGHPEYARSHVFCHALLHVTDLLVGRHLFMTEEIGVGMEEICKNDDGDEHIIDKGCRAECGDLNSGWEVALLEGVIFALAKILEVIATYSLYVLLPSIEAPPSLHPRSRYATSLGPIAL